MRGQNWIPAGGRWVNRPNHQRTLFDAWYMSTGWSYRVKPWIRTVTGGTSAENITFIPEVSNDFQLATKRLYVRGEGVNLTAFELPFLDT